jgi:hypothetical protein
LAGFSLNPKFLKSSLAIRLLNVLGLVCHDCNKWERGKGTTRKGVEDVEDLPVHAASQVGFGQHPTLVFINAFDLLHAAQVGHHDILAFP